MTSALRKKSGHDFFDLFDYRLLFRNEAAFQNGVKDTGVSGAVTLIVGSHVLDRKLGADLKYFNSKYELYCADQCGMQEKEGSNMRTVTFATKCWERDWSVMVDTRFLLNKTIRNKYPFAEKLLVINNVKNRAEVAKRMDDLVSRGVITNYVFVSDCASDALRTLGLRKSPSWAYYYSIGELVAIFNCNTEYLLYVQGDVWLPESVSWIDLAMDRMEKDSRIKVATLVANKYFETVRYNSFYEDADFYFDYGFSDQLFLVRKRDFRAPIYSETKPPPPPNPYDESYSAKNSMERAAKWLRDVRRRLSKKMHGEDFEGMVDSWMKNHGYSRIIFKRGYYRHQNIPKNYLSRRLRILRRYYDNL